MYSIIVAHDLGHGIGYQNSMPGPRLSQDWQHLKSKTTGHKIIMGRKTWDSLGPNSPLPNRKNAIITRNVKNVGLSQDSVASESTRSSSAGCLIPEGSDVVGNYSHSGVTIYNNIKSAIE